MKTTGYYPPTDAEDKTMTDSPATPPAIFGAMSAAQADLARAGVAKLGKNQQQGFMYRAWDDLQQALAPILAAHRLLIIPHIESRTESSVTTKSGSQMFRVVLQGHLEFLSGVDGSSYRFQAFGEASDTGDKGTSKALTMLVKYAVLHAFCVPLAGVPDSDAETAPETAPETPADPVSDKITEIQIADLQALAEEGGADMDKFLKFLGVSTLAELPAAEVSDALHALERKRSAK